MLHRRVWPRWLNSNLSLLISYASLLSGSAGRLVFSLAFFVSIANHLTIADFGLFATASAVGTVLARVAGFGFDSPLYRVATVKGRLIGVYTAGFLAAFVLSLPAVALAAALFYALFFAGEMQLFAFAAIIAAEVLFWRLTEIVVIVNNGLNRFTRAAALVILGSALRAVAAVLFAAFLDGSLLVWSGIYLAANALTTLAAFAFFYPRRRLRLHPALYFPHWRDSVSTAAAEIVFYVQSDLDRLLVLSLGGAQNAGIYAIIMRLIDLTALPVRSFTTMAVQKLMRTPQWLASSWRRVGIEVAIATVSVAGITFLGGFLWLFPTALGENVAQAAPFVLLALLVPAFRNLVEYESELLYAQGKTTSRAVVLVLIGAAKAGLLFMLLAGTEETSDWIARLNGVFLLLWIISVCLTYPIFDRRIRFKSVPQTAT